MKNKKRLLILLVALVVAGGVSMIFGSSGYFQGRINLNEFSVSLSPSSPSGLRSVSPTDTVAVFTICKNLSTKIPLVSLRFNLKGPDDLNPSALADPVSNPNRFALEGEEFVGSYSVVSSSSSNVEVNYKLRDPMKMEKRSCKDVRVVLDSAELLNERAGSDDRFQVTLKDLYATASTGHVRVSSNAPVDANMLSY
ncbi:MAG: hypothetical protein WC285_02335 [Candidatus Gracilibacteria bacterium]|jgi:hypothetical protein